MVRLTTIGAIIALVIGANAEIDGQRTALLIGVVIAGVTGTLLLLGSFLRP